LDPRNYISFDSENPSQFYLEYNFGIPFKNMLVEKYTLQIILPEGVTNLNYSLPVELSDVRQSFDRYYSYLDFFGRPVIVFEKDNLLDFHNERKFVVSYNFDHVRMMIEPTYLIFAFAGIFTFGIIFGRSKFDFRAKSKDE